MRLKTTPADFRVEELSRPPPLDARGEFEIFRVEKRGVAAFDAIEAIARALGVPARDVAFAGLKDLRSEATQLASVRRAGPPAGAGTRVHVAPGLDLVLLGRAARALRSDDIERNRFTLVVRDVTLADAAAIPARVEAVRRTGLASYFDDQRFGGASPERGFVAEAWSKGDLERALLLLVARPSPKDPRRERLEKKAIAAALAAADAARGGGPASGAPRWPAATWQALAREVHGEAAPVVRALARDPGDLAAAFRALDARLRSLLVSQWQSFLWNEAAAKAVREALPRAASFDVMYRCGTFVFWRSAADPIALAPLLHREIDFAELAIPEALGVRAKAGARALILRPDAIEAGPDEADDLHAGRRKLTLRLELPRSAYATLVAKRLFYEPNAGANAGPRADV